jgi:uncharacterized protein with ATP-grasp and redox domains
LKVEAECAACVLQRGYLETEKATDNPSLQFKTMSALINLLIKEFKPTAVAAYLGTQRDRVIKEVTGNPDPYAKAKQISNQKAVEILPLAKNIVLKGSSPESRFRRACLCSMVGNIMEFDIPDHTFKFEDLEKLIQGAEEDLAIDEIPEIFNQAKKAKRILYLTDNAGEIALDTLLVQELKKFGANVTVAVKTKPILNDATIEDAEYVGMHNVADNVITTGSDSVGLILEECSTEFLKLYNSADLVVAKGMGHAETLTEINLKTPHALLLRTKCRPVANYFGVDRNKNVAKMMMP